jgi:hypothetical protein
VTDTPKDKDNVVEIGKKSKKKDSGVPPGGEGGDGEPPKNAFYSVTPVVPVAEAEDLIRLKYMTESGYLDILGIINQIQAHNKRRMRTTLERVVAINVLSTVVGSVIVAVIMGKIQLF